MDKEEMVTEAVSVCTTPLPSNRKPLSVTFLEPSGYKSWRGWDTLPEDLRSEVG